MSREKKLFKDTLIYIVGNFGSKFISIIMLRFYTTYLNTSEYGTIDILTVTASLIMPIVSFQISDSAFRMIIGEESYNKRKGYISSVFTLLFINSAVFVIILLILNSVFNIFNSEYYIYVIFMVITGVIYEAVCQSIRGLKLSKVYASLGILFTIIFTTSNFIYIAKLNQGIEGYLKSQIIAYVITSIVGVISSKLYLYYKFSIDKLVIKELLVYSVPLIPNILCWWILNVSDRYILLYYTSSEQVGIYSFGNKITNLMYMVNTVFMLAWQSNSIDTYKETDRDNYYSKVFNYYSIVQSLLVIGFSISSYFLVYLFGGKEYADAYKYIPLLALAILFNTFATYYANNYIILKKTKDIMKTTFIAAVLNIIISIITIPYIGIYGAILSTIISYMAVWLIRVFDKKMPIKIKINKFSFILNILLSTTSCIIIIINISLIMKILTLIVILIIFIINNITFLFKEKMEAIYENNRYLLENKNKKSYKKNKGEKYRNKKRL